MKRIHCWIYLLLAIVGLSACQGKKEGGTRTISVTIEPQRYFAEKIAGDLFQINCVTPAGQSPETYDPTPQQMVQISQSQAYFRIGEIGFEQAWMTNLQSQNPDMVVFDLSEGMELIKNEEEVHEEGEAHHHHHHGSVDPHIWTSIFGARVIAQNTCQAFIKLDPENQEIYRAGYQRLIEEIDSTEAVTTISRCGFYYLSSGSDLFCSRVRFETALYRVGWERTFACPTETIAGDGYTVGGESCFRTTGI